MIAYVKVVFMDRRERNKIGHYVMCTLKDMTFLKEKSDIKHLFCIKNTCGFYECT